MDTQMINFTIPKKLLRAMDDVARRRARNRSEFIREAVRKFIDEEESTKAFFQAIRQNALRSNLTEEEAMQLAEEAKQWARKQSK